MNTDTEFEGGEEQDHREHVEQELHGAYAFGKFPPLQGEG